MTPAARTQAAIEMLDAILTAAQEGGAAADTLIARYFAARRYAGSTDRRVIREFVYAAIRMLGERPATGRAAMIALAAADPALAATFDGSAHGARPIDPLEPVAQAGIVPAWLAQALRASAVRDEDWAALVGRAPLDIRVNMLRADPDTLTATIAGAQPITGLPNALRLPAGTRLDTWAGAVEVQDAGSQAVTLAADATPGQHIVDLCAGAGGKTLALAAAMGNRGVILATDTDRQRLARLGPRAEQAGVTIATTRLIDPGREVEMLGDWYERADCVLIDAPCSGTGTWRRNPEARWRLSPKRLAQLVDTQRRLLATGATLIRPGGALVYIVCSLLDDEGRDQADRFLLAHPDWRVDRVALPFGQPHGNGVRLSPVADGTDGFFVARVRRPC